MAQLQIILPDATEQTHELAEEKNTVGRVEDNTLCIPFDSVSSHHAEIVFEGGAFHLHDLGSTNGTFVNSEQVADAILNHGDEIRFGAIPAIFLSAAAVSAADAQPLPDTASKGSEAAAASARPANFVSTSPVPRNVQTKDVTGMLALAAGVVALLASAAVAAMALTMSA